MVRDLLQQFIQKVFVGMTKDSDAETLEDAAQGISACVKNAGEGMLQDAEVKTLIDQMTRLLQESFLRTTEYAKEKKSRSAPQDDDDADDDENQDADEEACRRAYVEVFGACMKSNPQAFVQHGAQVVGGLLQSWLQTKENKLLALWLMCDIVENLKEQSQPFWAVGMQAVMGNLH